MHSTLRTVAFALAFVLLVAAASHAQLVNPVVLSDPRGSADAPEPQNVRLIDRPGDAGTALVLLFDLDSQDTLYVLPQVRVDGKWAAAVKAPIALQEVPKVADLPGVFGIWPRDKDSRAIVIESYIPPPAHAPGASAAGAPEAAAVASGDEETVALEPGQTYQVQLSVSAARGMRNVDAGTEIPRENLFAWQRLNILLIGFLFATIILVAIFRARANPGNIFVRRIAGLEAVEEAIGRATEMGKPVMQINGLDGFTTPSTIAAVNLLGQIARKVAHYDSRLMVPSFDPVVMTVSQETVKQAYIAEGRPDAYREEDIFFVTDQQFSYVASVCGLMLREKPAANFFLGAFYAESLLLAETGQSTGAIQIAGTDSQAQLPFFITTCDYTLIGEELYAASAYLSREPMLLGGLKGLDFSKVIIMLLIFLGSILATFGIEFLTELFTPLG
ncbi:MAG: hypothetical protein M3R04_01300 [bacterium]|nr:hypothetical protein [bacterium]